MPATIPPWERAMPATSPEWERAMPATVPFTRAAIQKPSRKTPGYAASISEQWRSHAVRTSELRCAFVKPRD